MTERYHYVGLEHSIHVFSSLFQVDRTIFYMNSNRPLTRSELNAACQSNPEVTPFYDQKLAQLTAEEHQALMAAKKEGKEYQFLDDLFSDPSRILVSKNHADPNHQYFDLVKKQIEKLNLK